MSKIPVVFVAGQLLTDAVFAPQIAALRDAGHEVIIADHQSDETIAGMALRLLANAPERFALVGLAMGGFVAFEVMRQAPERVDRMALLATLAPNDGPAQTARRQGYIDLVESGRFAEVIEERIPILFAPDKRDDAALLALARQMAADIGADTFMQQQRAIMTRADSRPSLPDMHVPVLLLWGDADGITTRAHQDEMLAGLPDARIEVIAGGGHLATLEQPEAVSEILVDWLR